MFELAVRHEAHRRVAQLIARKLAVHAVNLCRVDEPLHVLRQTKDRRAFARLVAANTLKNA